MNFKTKDGLEITAELVSTDASPDCYLAAIDVYIQLPDSEATWKRCIFFDNSANKKPFDISDWEHSPNETKPFESVDVDITPVPPIVSATFEASFPILRIVFVPYKLVKESYENVAKHVSSAFSGAPAHIKRVGS